MFNHRLHSVHPSGINGSCWRKVNKVVCPKSLYFIRTMQIWNIEHGVTGYSDVLESLRFDLIKSRGLHSSVVPGTFIRGCVKSICQIPPGIQCRECGGCRNVSRESYQYSFGKWLGMRETAIHRMPRTREREAQTCASWRIKQTRK